MKKAEIQEAIEAMDEILYSLKGAKKIEALGPAETIFLVLERARREAKD